MTDYYDPNAPDQDTGLPPATLAPDGIPVAHGVDGHYYTRDAADRERLEEYAEAEKLLDLEEHEALFRDQRRSARAHWVPIDFAGMLARLVRHYVFGTGFEVRAVVETAQPEIDRIAKASELMVLLKEACEAGVVLGDAVIRVDLSDVEGFDEDEPRTATFRYVRPHYYFPTLHPMDKRRVTEVTLAWILKHPSRDDQMVLREIHRPGEYEFLLNTWDGKNIGEELDLALVDEDLPDGVQDTGIDEIPIIHVPYQRKAGGVWGESEFERIHEVLGRLENRLSQEDEVLTKHARPKLVVGPGLLDDQGRANLQDFDVIEIDNSILERAVRPEYLTWNMQIDALKHEIEKLEEYFFMTTETSPASFGLERDGSQVESARALKFKAHRTVNKVEDIRLVWDAALRRLFRIAQKLELAEGDRTYEPSDVTLVWPDPIVEDQSQETVDYSTLKGARLVSRRRALKDLWNLTDSEAALEEERILQDIADEAATEAPPLAPAPAGGLPAEAGGAAGLAGAIPPAAEAEIEVETPEAEAGEGEGEAE